MNLIQKILIIIALMLLCGQIFAQSSNKEQDTIYNYTSEEDLSEWCSSVSRSSSFHDEWTFWTGTIGDKIKVDTDQKIIYLYYWDFYPKEGGSFIKAKKLYSGSEKAKQDAVKQFIRKIENYYKSLTPESCHQESPKSILFSIGCHYLLRVTFSSFDEQKSMTINFKPNTSSNIFRVSPKNLENFYYSELLEKYRKEAEQGNADSQYKLGSMYLHGRGVPQDYAEALKWCHKSAEQGDAKGQCSMGTIYLLGLGVNKDLEKAKYWYEKSAAQDNEVAKALLESMKEKE